jgi:multidrug resistance efflux pump
VADSTPTPTQIDPTRATRSRNRTPAAEASSLSWLWFLRWLPSALVALHLYRNTDDAQVNGHLIQVSARVAGQVAKVYVEENQVVKAGDVIAELDPSDYKVAVENAEAALASAQANAAAANVNVPITTVNTGSNLRSADANVSGSQAGVGQAEKQLEPRTPA